MGLAGGLVRKVFSKHQRSPSCGTDSNVDKSRWNLSKLNFCMNDFDSVHADGGEFTSFERSESTAVQVAVGAHMSEASLKGGGESNGETSGEKNTEENLDDAQGSEGRRRGKEEEYAVLVIQSAFRRFMERRREEQAKEARECQEVGSPGRASLDSSTEAQAGDSVKNVSVHEEGISIPHPIRHKLRKRSSTLKEEWDDSTVSSSISRIRIQNRLEAVSRRERALAYAFSQQLRLCSNKRKQAVEESAESNMSWNWLERWMATRRPENLMLEDCSSRKNYPYMNHTPSILRNRSDVNLQESCGSNDVPMSCENTVIPSLSNLRDGYRAVKNRLKAPRETRRRNNSPSYHYAPPPNKVVKSLREKEKEKQKQMEGKARGSVSNQESNSSQ